MATIKEFRESLRGGLIEPLDKEYDDARKVYNAMISKHPRMIARCMDVADVIRSVNFARENNILLSIRSGGHNAGGLGICEDGLVIDLSRMNYTRIDPQAKTVVVGGGCTWGDIDHATHVFGMATPSGIISTTGVGGLTTGGGIGYFTRKYGLSIDNLLSVDMVLADGSFVVANADQNQDLFWAVRGGGGNFGVVTAFTFKLHPISMVYGGPILYELSEAEEVMKWYRELIKDAPDDLNGFFAFLTVPPAAPFPEHLHLKKMCGIVWAFTGPMENAEKTFKPIRSFKTPALDFVGPLPQPVLQSMFDGLYPPGLQWYWRADFVKELSDEAITAHIRFANELPTMHSTMHLYPINGAASRISKTDTPWSYRDATWAMVIVGVDPDPVNKEKITTWTKQYWEALHPYSAGGAYVNFMMDEGEERVKATYGENYERLAAIKRKYDPNNLFRVNQNIKPHAPLTS
ncbi:MAG: FAD-binding oxidoreductase [Candidatus Pedobacter colombiensis]|uniref:FAD-binding oxidoreductase n=1 Tax=Candidatus Pedobacter colombiensis TaxID=3121371 RepID=A0AAJ5W5T6_9SPHI|nr:FAD-binding oxidoreductase [Pedobacter sp.]WEK17801.1 MAG: FAD-binding oxidoreductase [Pedobacter sp.]